jgi:hypothetical protein
MTPQRELEARVAAVNAARQGKNAEAEKRSATVQAEQANKEAALVAEFRARDGAANRQRAAALLDAEKVKPSDRTRISLVSVEFSME